MPVSLFQKNLGITPGIQEDFQKYKPQKKTKPL